MPKRKYTKKKKPWAKKAPRKTLINRGVNPIADSYITTVEYNDVMTLGNALASVYTIYGNNQAFAPYVATNMSGVNNDSPYGWSKLSSLYARYAVLSASIHLECINQSTVPVMLAVTSQRSSSANTDVENILGNPRAKTVMVGNFTNKGKLSMYTKPWQELGIDPQDDTYRALTSSNPALAHYWQISAFSADAATACNGGLRVIIRYRVKFTDRIDLVQ